MLREKITRNYTSISYIIIIIIIIIIIVVVVVVGALGIVKNGMVENIKKVSERATVTEIQKICMLGSARILFISLIQMGAKAQKINIFMSINH